MHIFFQYNPRALQWGAPFWAHVATRDLVRWTWLPPALLPDTAYDAGGVWSGSTTIDDNGTPHILYTAAGTSVPEAGNYWQRQAAAVPANLSDPLLRKWIKPRSNPFLSQVYSCSTLLQMHTSFFIGFATHICARTKNTHSHSTFIL